MEQALVCCCWAVSTVAALALQTFGQAQQEEGFDVAVVVWRKMARR